LRVDVTGFGAGLAAEFGAGFGVGLAGCFVVERF
jgi:hypothetical protein